MIQTDKRVYRYRLFQIATQGLINFSVNIPNLDWKRATRLAIVVALTMVILGLGVLPVETNNQADWRRYPVVETPEMTVHDYATDKRTLALKKYLTEKRSPVAEKAAVYVYAADLYDLKPWPILAAIAGKESSFCKRVPSGSYNCYGWGVTGGKVVRFGSYEEGIMTVAAGLKRRYYDRGLETIPEIETRYTPISAATHHEWQREVSQFVVQIEDEYHELIWLADASAGL